MRGDNRMANKRSSFGSIVRKRLSDITNYSLPQPKSPVVINVDKDSPEACSAKDHIHQLVRENTALVKLIQDKNKIIELSGVELQKLRIALQRMQLQNWNLAQSNSRMLAELNLGKEKLKALQHELVCKEALLKAKDLKIKELETWKHQQKGLQEAIDGIVLQEANRATKDQKPSNSNRRRRPARSRSMGHSTTSRQDAGKDAAETKRRCLRRQSAKSRTEEWEGVDLFEIEDINFSINTPFGSPDNEAKDEYGGSRVEAKQLQRTSIGRPMRRAVEKVQSYKEIPLNTKMRRSS